MHNGVAESQLVSRRTKPGRWRRRVAITLASLLGCLAIGLIFLVHNWPFTRDSITQALQQESGSTVQIGRFDRTYLPYPACVAGDVVFRRGSNANPPFMVIRELTITGSYPELLIHHVSTIRADGLRLSVKVGQPSDSNSPPVNIGSLRSGLTIGKIVADNAEIEFPASDEDGQALVFRIPKLALHDLAGNQPLSYRATVQLPLPPAEVEIAGEFGPWQAGRGGESRMTGSYKVKSLDLSAFSGIRGTSTASGSFAGILRQVQVQGSVDTPDFEVRRSRHPVHLAADYAAIVDGLNGDVALKAGKIHWGRTTIDAAGSVAAVDDAAGKTATFDLSSSKARIQDLLWLFVSEDKSPMTGAIVFRARATLPPGHRPFIDKVRLDGDFGVSGAQYPNPGTQKNVDMLSARARGEADKVEDKDDQLGNNSYDPGRVLSNVKGHILLSNGVAKLSDVHFDVPGASAQVNGTYKLTTEQIDLRGQMWLDTELSKATTGVKSFLLKVIQPLTATKKHKGSIVSLTIGGTYQHPTYTVLPMAKR
jgi:hypothetical protein